MTATPISTIGRKTATFSRRLCLADPYPSRAPQPSGYETEPAASSRYFSGPAVKFSGFREDGGDYVAVDDAQYRPRANVAFAGAVAGLRDAQRLSMAMGQTNRSTTAVKLTARTIITTRHRYRAGVVWSSSWQCLAWRWSGRPAHSAIAPCSVVRCCLRCRRSSRRATGRTRSCQATATRKRTSKPGRRTRARPKISSRVRSSRSKWNRRKPLMLSPPFRFRPGQARLRRRLRRSLAYRRLLRPGGGAPPASTAAPPPPAAPAPASISSEPKKIHTVTIRADQPNSLGSAPLQPGSTARSAARPAAPAPKPSTTASAPAGGAPLSIVPGAEGGAQAAAPARARAAVAPASGAPMAVASATPARRSRPLRPRAATRCNSRRSAVRPTPRPLSAPCRRDTPISSGGREPILRRADLGCQGSLLPRPCRPLCLDGRGRRHVQQPQGRRRQLHRPEKLTASAPIWSVATSIRRTSA